MMTVMLSSSQHRNQHLVSHPVCWTLVVQMLWLHVMAAAAGCQAAAEAGTKVGALDLEAYAILTLTDRCLEMLSRVHVLVDQ
jgi:hypothetical protein